VLREGGDEAVPGDDGPCGHFIEQVERLAEAAVAREEGK
jgi:hypothetical protein